MYDNVMLLSNLIQPFLLIIILNSTRISWLLSVKEVFLCSAIFYQEFSMIKYGKRTTISALGRCLSALLVKMMNLAGKWVESTLISLYKAHQNSYKNS